MNGGTNNLLPEIHQIASGTGWFIASYSEQIIKTTLCASTFSDLQKVEMSRNVQSGNTQNLKSTVIQRSFPKWSVAERRKTAAASDQAAVCACAHSRYFAGGSPSGLRV